MSRLLFIDIPSIFSGLWYLLMKGLYFLVTCCLSLLDMLQLVFRRVAGLDVYYVDNGTVAKEGDILLDLINDIFLNPEFSVLATVFYSFLILGLILLIITTIIGVLRTEYTPDKETKDNGKMGVLKNTVKAIFTFLLVPIFTIFGVFLGNGVLIAVDRITDSGINTTITYVDEVDSFVEENGSKIFIEVGGTSVSTSYLPISSIASRATLYYANRARVDDKFYNNLVNGQISNFDIFNQFDNQAETANAIDEAFMINATFVSGASTSLDYDYVKGGIEPNEVVDIGWGHVNGEVQSFNRNNSELVSYYFNLYNYNFILAFLFIYFALKIMLSLVFGLMQRIIEVVGLLLISPIIISTMPLNGGGSQSQWVGVFATRVFSIYIAVFALNLFNIFYPIIFSISFFSPTPNFLDQTVQVIFLIAALLAVKSMDKVFAFMLKVGKASHSIIGSGEGITNEVQKSVVTGIKGVSTAATIPIAAGGAVWGGANFVTGFVGGFGTSNRKKKKLLKSQEDLGTAKKAGKKEKEDILNDAVKTDAVNKAGGNSYADERAQTMAGDVAQFENQTAGGGKSDVQNSFEAADKKYNDYISSGGVSSSREGQKLAKERDESKARYDEIQALSDMKNAKTDADRDAARDRVSAAEVDKESKEAHIDSAIDNMAISNRTNAEHIAVSDKQKEVDKFMEKRQFKEDRYKSALSGLKQVGKFAERFGSIFGLGKKKKK